MYTRPTSGTRERTNTEVLVSSEGAHANRRPVASARDWIYKAYPEANGIRSTRPYLMAE